MPAFDGACFVQFNKGSASQGLMYQNRPGSYPAGAYTAESAVRCRSGQGVSSCRIGIMVLGSGGTAEGRWAEWDVPANDAWFICRADTNHASGGPAAFQYSHTTLSWYLYNYSGVNLDMDYTFLGGKTTVELASELPFGMGNNLDAGNSCTQR